MRRASVRDIAALTEQRHRMFLEMDPESKKGIRTHDRAFPAWARREMRAKRLVCFLVEDGKGAVLGGGSLWLREVQPFPGFPGGKIPYLMSMYTDPSCRGKGVGSAVLKEAIAWSKARGYLGISLHASNMGRSLYEKFGWRASREMELELD